MTAPPGGSEDADAVMRAFCADLEGRGTRTEWRRGQLPAVTPGCFEYWLYADGRRHLLEVPAVPLRRIRWADCWQDPDEPYQIKIGGEPYSWPLALALCRE